MNQPTEPKPLTNPFQEVPMSETKPCPDPQGQGDAFQNQDDISNMSETNHDPLVEEVERRMYAVFNKRIGCVLDVAILAQSRQEAVSVAVAMLRERETRIAEWRELLERDANRIAELEKEVSGLRALEASVNEALNRGNGTYKP